MQVAEPGHGPGVRDVVVCACVQKTKAALRDEGRGQALIPQRSAPPCAMHLGGASLLGDSYGLYSYGLYSYGLAPRG